MGEAGENVRAVKLKHEIKKLRNNNHRARYHHLKKKQMMIPRKEGRDFFVLFLTRVSCRHISEAVNYRLSPSL